MHPPSLARGLGRRAGAPRGLHHAKATPQLRHQLYGHAHHGGDHGKPRARQLEQAVLGEHARRVGNPLQHGHQAGPHAQAVRERLQPHRDGAQRAEDRHARLREERVCQADERDHGQLPAQLRERPAPARAADRKAERARDGQRRKHGLQHKDSDADDAREVHRGHHRMAGLERERAPAAARLHATAPRPRSSTRRNPRHARCSGRSSRWACFRLPCRSSRAKRPRPAR